MITKDEETWTDCATIPGFQLSNIGRLKNKETDRIITPLNTAKAYVDKLKYKKDGVECPCCQQKAKVWKKSIVSTAVADLIMLVRLFDGEHPLHKEDFTLTPKDRNFSQLVFWRLIHPNISEKSMNRKAGLWTPTQEGYDFVIKNLKIPKYIQTYNNEFLGFEGDDIDVVDALNNKFDYMELMKLDVVDKAKALADRFKHEGDEKKDGGK